MRPEARSNLLFSAMQARAKMREFRAAEADFNVINRDPSSLLALAIGILGDAAAALADHFISPATGDGRPKTWEEADGSIPEMVRFSARYFDSFLELLRRFYALEDVAEQLRTLCNRLKTSVYSSGSAREVFYADVVVALCARKLDSASTTILPPSSGLPPSTWASTLIKEGFPIELWPAQKLICGEGILNGRSAVI